MSTITNRYFPEIDPTQVAFWGFALAAWVFILEYSLYLVTADFPDKLIKLAAFGCMAVFLGFQRSKVSTDEKKLLMLFAALLLSGLLPSVLTLDSVGMQQWLKMALMSTTLLFVLMRVQVLRGQGELLILLYLGLAVLFSLQAIVGFFSVLFCWLDSSVVLEVGRRPGQVVTSLGLLGYANAIQTPIEGVRVLRPQGWFVEPSILAAFLLYPAFASFAHYRQAGKIIFLVFSVAMFVAIFMTFSLAGYFAILAVMLFLVLSRPLHARLKQRRMFKYIYPVLILLLFVVLTKGILFGAQKMNEINLQQIHNLMVLGKYGDHSNNTALEKFSVSASKMFARDPQGQSGNLFRETYKTSAYLSVLARHPFGIGFGSTLGSHEVNSGNALVFWAISGGMPAVALVLVFWGYFFWTFCHPLLNSGNIVYRCAAASFIGHAIHNMSYGNWLAPFFLLHLAIVILYARQFPQASELSPSNQGRNSPFTS
jgi:hypothetical protein